MAKDQSDQADKDAAKDLQKLQQQAADKAKDLNKDDAQKAAQDAADALQKGDLQEALQQQQKALMPFPRMASPRMARVNPKTANLLPRMPRHPAS